MKDKNIFNTFFAVHFLIAYFPPRQKKSMAEQWGCPGEPP